MMACAQLGITLCGVLLGALGEPAVAALLEPVFHALGVPEAWLHPVALVVALLLVVSAHVALGEMVPKNIAIAGPGADRAGAGARPAGRSPRRSARSSAFLNAFANAVVRLTGREPKDEVTSSFTREEVADLVAESRAEGLLDDEEHQRITSALDFDTTAVVAGDGAGRRGGVASSRCHRRRDRADLRADRLLPLPDPRTRTAGSPVTCTSATSSTFRRTGGTNRCRPTEDPGAADGARRAPTCAPRWTGCGGSARTWPRSTRAVDAGADGTVNALPAPDRSDGRGRHRLGRHRRPTAPATEAVADDRRGRPVTPATRASMPPVAACHARGRHRDAVGEIRRTRPGAAPTGRRPCTADASRHSLGPCSGGSWGSKPSSGSPARSTGSAG